MNIRDSDDDSFIDDSEYETDASSHSGKEKEKNGDDKDEVEILGSASEDEWRPRRRTRQAAAVKKYSLLVNEFVLLLHQGRQSNVIVRSVCVSVC